jgi:hypothetical protein
MKTKHKRVRINSREAKRLQNAGWRIINTDSSSGWITFESAK